MYGPFVPALNSILNSRYNWEFKYFCYKEEGVSLNIVGRDFSKGKTTLLAGTNLKNRGKTQCF